MIIGPLKSGTRVKAVGGPREGQRGTVLHPGVNQSLIQWKDEDSVYSHKNLEVVR